MPLKRKLKNSTIIKTFETAVKTAKRLKHIETMLNEQSVEKDPQIQDQKLSSESSNIFPKNHNHRDNYQNKGLYYQKFSEQKTSDKNLDQSCKNEHRRHECTCL